MSEASTSLDVLLRGAIDYAGLFPPAQLSMREAVTNYASYLSSDDAWALGRFVVPAARLEELAREARALDALTASPWRVSALIGSDVAGDLARIRAFDADPAGATGPASRESGWCAVVDSVELRGDSEQAIDRALGEIPSSLERYAELPLAGDVEALVRVVARHGAYAKVRTGGTTSEAFPSAHDVLRFVRACVAAGVRFKATAGLHHPLRAEYRLTYSPDSGRATMFGFLNVFLCAAFVAAGADDATAIAVLGDGDPASVRFDEQGAEWRGHRLTLEALSVARERTITSFGSCSFREPVDELAALHLLRP